MQSILRHGIATLLLAALALLGADRACAQSATVIVTVTNEAGEAQSFVDVMLEGQDGNPFNTADLTDENGVLRFVGVPVGKFKVSATTDGSASDNYIIELGPGAVQEVKVILKRFQAQEQVVEVISSVAELVDTAEVSTATTVSGEFISKIPLQNRRIEDIVAMMPGVVRVGSSDSTEISIGGGTSAQIAYRIDGISGNDPIDGGLRLQLPSAAIASFKLITSGASAKYGEQSTGIAEIVTKSGGNENDFTYEVQWRDSEYGAQSMGELDDINQYVNDLITAEGSPLQGEVRAGFRLLGVDPLSTTEDDNNPVPRRRVRHTVSAGGPIKRDEAFFHTTLESVQDDYGSPFVQGFGQNDNILWTSKVNWDIWKKDQASNRLEITANLDVADDAGYTGVLAPRSVNTLSTRGAWTVGLTDTHVFPNLGVLESKLSLAHNYETTRPEDVRTGVGTSYQIPLPPGGPVSYTVGAAGVNYDQDVLTIRAETNYAKAVGARSQHTMDIGFNADQTFFKSFVETGDQVSDLRVVDDTRLFGGNTTNFVGNAFTFGPPVKTDDSAWYAALYASDNWQVTDNFVIQTGLRLEYQSFVGKLFLAPRIGFSLDPIGDGRTRFFGNWGIYYDRLFANFLQYTQQPNRYIDEIRFAPQFDDNLWKFSRTTILDIYKEARTTPQNSPNPNAVAFLVPIAEDRFVGADDLTAPTNKDWTLGISRQLPGRIRLEVTYRSNSRTHQITNDVITRELATTGGSARTIRDVIYGTRGEGSFRQWSAEVTRPFAASWSMNLSYVQSKSYGPIGAPLSPIDPNDVEFVQGTLGNDRTHVVKLQGNTKIGKGKAAVDAAADFTWQTGLPVSAAIVSASGSTSYPLGRNTFRLPSTRQLNFNLSKSLQLNTKEGGGFLPTLQFRAAFFNLLNQVNVTSGFARFKVPEGTATPGAFPPLRPELLVTGVDVSRSLELGFSISF